MPGPRRGSRPKRRGRTSSLTQTEVVANPADLGLAVLGGPQAAAYLSAGLGPGVREPADLLVGRRRPHRRASAPPGARRRSTAPASSSAPVMPEPAQTRAVSQIVSAVSGSPPSSPAVSTLLLSPLLESLVDPVVRDPSPPTGTPGHHREGRRLHRRVGDRHLDRHLVAARREHAAGHRVRGRVLQRIRAAAGRHRPHRRRRGGQGQRRDACSRTTPTCRSASTTPSTSRPRRWPPSTSRTSSASASSPFSPGSPAASPLPPGGVIPAGAHDAGDRPDGRVRRLRASVLGAVARPGQPAGGVDHRRLPGRVGDDLEHRGRRRRR